MQNLREFLSYFILFHIKILTGTLQEYFYLKYFNEFILPLFS
mgnify:CR=1 FL=1|jgi:hypothetical protein